MFKFVSRLCTALAALMLFASPALCASAEGQVHIAVDKQDVLPLACAFAYRAEQMGAQVRMHNIGRPNEEPFYVSGSDTTLSQTAENLREKSVDKVEQHLTDFLSAFFQNTAFTDEATEVVVITNFDRGRLVFGGWDAEKSEFKRSDLKRAYQAICDAMDAHPNLSVTLCYASYRDAVNNSALDERLVDRYPDRISYQVLLADVPIRDLIAPVFTSAARTPVDFTSASSTFASRALEGTVPADGVLSYEVKGEAELLRLSFPGEAQPTDVSFTLVRTPHADDAAQDAHALTPEASPSAEPEASPSVEPEASPSVEPEASPGAEPEASPSVGPEASASVEPKASLGAEMEASIEKSEPLRAFYDGASQAYWLYLPSVEAETEIVIACQQEAAQAMPYALTAWSALPEGRFTLLDAQGQPVAAGQSAALSSEPTRWTLELELPGFTVEEITTSLTATRDGDSVPASLVKQTTRDGICQWTYELPAFSPDSAGTILAEYAVWNRTPAAQIQVAYTAQNRAPTLADGVEDPVVLDMYCDLPTLEPAPDDVYKRQYDLAAYFTDADAGDALTFADSSAATASYTRSISGGVLTYGARQLADRPVSITVTAADKSGETASLTFEFRHLSARSALNQLRMTPDEATAAMQDGGQYRIPIGEERTLRFTLAEDDEAAVNAMLTFFKMPALEECLIAQAGDIPGTWSREEDGLLALTFDLPASAQTAQQTYALSARFAATSGDVACEMELPSLLGVAALDVCYSNEPPRLRAGIDADNALADGDIEGLPGQYAPVALSSLLDASLAPDGVLLLNDLFENEESAETLTYVLRVDSGSVRVVASDGSTLADGLTAGSTYSLTQEDAAQGIDILLLTPGESAVAITAQDTENASEQALVYRVKLHAAFMRRLIIGLCVAVLLIAALVAFLIVRSKLKPSFGATCAAISHMRSLTNEIWTESGTYTTIRLAPYGKRPVSLLTLLAAAGVPVLNPSSSEALACIAFSPDKRGGLVASRGKSDAVMLVNGRAVAARSIRLADKQTLTIHFGDPQKALNLCIFTQ